VNKRRFDFGHLTSGVIVPALIMGAIAAGYFLVWPQYVALNKSKSDLVVKQGAVADRKTAMSSVKGLITDLEKKRQSLSAMDEGLPASPDLPSLLVNIEYLASQSGMALENLQIAGSSTGPSNPSGQSKKQDSSTGIITIDLTVNGQYPQLQALILNIERNLRLLDIKSINFAQPSGETGTRSYALQFMTYYQKP